MSTISPLKRVGFLNEHPLLRILTLSNTHSPSLLTLILIVGSKILKKKKKNSFYCWTGTAPTRERSNFSRYGMWDLGFKNTKNLVFIFGFGCDGGDKLLDRLGRRNEDEG